MELTEEEFERRLNSAFQNGISAGMNQASRTLIEKAGEAFKMKDDVKAKLYRELSAYFADLSKGSSGHA